MSLEQFHAATAQWFSDTLGEPTRAQRRGWAAIANRRHTLIAAPTGSGKTTFIQRVGRSGHTISGTPKGRLFPVSRDDLIECAALLRSVRRGELDRIVSHDAPLDVLTQQIVAETACREYSEDELFALATRRVALSRARAPELRRCRRIPPPPRLRRSSQASREGGSRTRRTSPWRPNAR